MKLYGITGNRQISQADYQLTVSFDQLLVRADGLLLHLSIGEHEREKLSRVYIVEDETVEIKTVVPPPACSVGRFSLTPQLTKQEQIILRFLINGDSNKVIARQMKLAEATVKTHIKAMLRKIHVTNRTQAAIWGMSHDYAAPDPHLA
jgi:DNA-binding CsgD family transcriptional regulator